MYLQTFKMIQQTLSNDGRPLKKEEKMRRNEISIENDPRTSECEKPRQKD